MRCVLRVHSKVKTDMLMQGYPAEDFAWEGEYATFVDQILMRPFVAEVPPLEEQFTYAYSGVVPPVQGQESAYDVPEDIELIDSQGVHWVHDFPLLGSAKVTLPPGHDPVPRAEAQKYVNVINSMRAFLRKKFNSMASSCTCGAVDDVVRSGRTCCTASGMRQGRRGGALPIVHASRRRPASEIEEETEERAELSYGRHSYSDYNAREPSTSTRLSVTERDSAPLRRSSRLTSSMMERQ